MPCPAAACDYPNKTGVICGEGNGRRAPSCPAVTAHCNWRVVGVEDLFPHHIRTIAPPPGPSPAPLLAPLPDPRAIGRAFQAAPMSHSRCARPCSPTLRRPADRPLGSKRDVAGEWIQSCERAPTSPLAPSPSCCDGLAARLVYMAWPCYSPLLLNSLGCWKKSRRAGGEPGSRSATALCTQLEVGEKGGVAEGCGWLRCGRGGTSSSNK